MDDLLKYMYSLERHGIKLGLEVMNKLLNKLGNPEQYIRFIHVAGTNGKGSTCAMIESILRHSGMNVGLYTSPHLVTFNERIRVNNELISDEKIIEYADLIKRTCEENAIEATFFEFTTALALLYFAEKECDYVVLETGLGGRLDATNAVNPDITIITNIDLDHQKFLGDTILEIAGEKAGIIKQPKPLLTSETKLEVLELFENICKQKLCDIYKLNEYKVIKSDINGTEFEFENNSYQLSLLGKHQVQNAVLAIKACEIIGLTIEEIYDGLKQAQWKGRLEVVSKDPLIIFDAAHNEAGVKTLANFIEENFEKVNLVIGMSENRNTQMFKPLLKYAQKIIITKADYKGVEPTEIQKEIEGEIILNPNDAVEKIDKNNPVIVTGSIYMLGNAYK